MSDSMLEKLYQEEAFKSLPPDVQESIKKVAKPCVGIDASIASMPLPLTSSKFGGVPFIAEGEDVPRDDKNRPFLLIAQFNFEEIKRMAGQHPDLPETGLLQIFIPPYFSDSGSIPEHSQIVRLFSEIPQLDKYNANVTKEYRAYFEAAGSFEKEQNQIRSESGLEWKERDEKIKSLPFYKEFGEPYFPIYDECELRFKPLLSCPDKNSVDIDYKECERWEEEIGEIGKAYLEEHQTAHRLLGFASGFCQDDPRRDYYYGIDEVPEKWKQYADEGGIVERTNLHLFLELSSQYIENNNGKNYPLMMWGDVGSAYFYITKEDLQARNFNNMEYSMQGH